MNNHIHGKLYIMIHLKLLKALHDRIDLLRSGLCYLVQEVIPHPFTTMAHDYIRERLPVYKYKHQVEQTPLRIGRYLGGDVIYHPSPQFSWPPGDVDRRRYWLKDRITELEILLITWNNE